MKKLLSLFLVMILSLSLVACSSENNQSSLSEQTETSQNYEEIEEQTESSNIADANSESNILIAYFTVVVDDGVDTVARASRHQWDDGTLGNTLYLSHLIQENIGGDLFSIETAEDYPVDSMDTLLGYAYSERGNNARPELKTHIDNIEDYDIIFIGYPNWNADLPMPLYTFFEEYDFSGKQ